MRGQYRGNRGQRKAKKDVLEVKGQGGMEIETVEEREDKGKQGKGLARNIVETAEGEDGERREGGECEKLEDKKWRERERVIRPYRSSAAKKKKTRKPFSSLLELLVHSHTISFQNPSPTSPRVEVPPAAGMLTHLSCS